MRGFALVLYMSSIYEYSLRSKNTARAGGYYSQVYYPLVFGGAGAFCWWYRASVGMGRGMAVR
jgi:hypothetical protein